MAWTDSDIKKLKQLWQKGLSTVAIGQALGISKNAVIGKVHRLQLQSRPSPIRSVEKKPAATGSKKAAQKAVKAPAKKTVVTKAPAKASAKAQTTAKTAAKSPVKKPAPKTAKTTPAKKPVKAKPVVKAAPKKVVVPAKPQKVEPKKVAPKKAERPEKPKAKAVALPKKATSPAPKAPAKGAQKKSVLIPQSRRELFTKHTNQSKHKGVSLVDLKATSCRWPLGDPNDPDFSFCGKEVVPGKPYCATHCLEAYTGVFKPR